MKRLYILISFLCLIGAATAQNSNQNYVVTRTMLNESSSSYLDVVKYYDGLGRLCQTVHNQVTPQKNNLLDLSEYDESGRDVKDWLPVYSSSAYLSASAFSSTASGNYGSTARPFNQSVYEASPSDRLVAQYGPGAKWSDKPMTTDYMLNGSSEVLSCVHYSVNGSTLVNGGSYATGELYVVRTQDEDGNTASQFTDKQGHTVLVSQLNGTVRHDTYYVYDDYGNLCYVLPPAMDGNISTASLNLYAYQYKYDRRNRCVWKKLPGADAVSYVYDLNDRLVFSQDGNQKSRGKWMFYLYDDLSRLVVQGECANTNTSTASARSVACTRVNTATGLGNSGYSSDFALTAPVVYLVNYYDNYDFRTLPGFNNSFFPANTLSAKGSLSGSVITVLGSETKLYSANYYDKKGRVTKSVSGNLIGGYETTTTVYTFTGKPATVTHVHTATGKTTQTEMYAYTYDHAERLTKVEHTLNGAKVTLAANTYDELGRLSGKSLHGSVSNKLAYAYNIRNWIESISSGGLFNISLYYGYNGNVSRMVCRCPGDNKTYGYNFAYDNLSRLTSAQSLIGGIITLGYATNYSYDKNGNLLHLRRGGQTGLSGTGIIDNLSFTLNGNQLKSVNDDATATASNGFEFKDGAKLATEYMYDANGSLIKDLNKGIEIQYNLLNLPSQVKFSDGSTITYTYGADGVKLRTVHKIGGVTTTTDYCDNVIYENGTAKQLLTEEGYVSLSDKKYHYYLKDHQGNNRVVTDQAGGMEEANYYYPFGGVFLSNGNDVQAYKYNGKELDTKKGLNWYDYGAREYDAVLGRWHVMDPSSEKYYGVSPYTYCKNNPILRIDIDGKDDYVVNKNGYVLFWKNTKYEDKGDRVYYFDGEHKPKQVSGKPITIMDNKLMPGMVESQGKEGRITTYGQTSNIHDAANLFKFAADNSVVEWKLDVYENENDGPTAIIITDHKEGSVESGNNAKRRTAVNGRKKIDIHSHPGDESQGASASDMKYINSRNNAVYLKRDRTLHDYNSKKSNITTIHINTIEDLQKYIQDRLKK